MAEKPTSEEKPKPKTTPDTLQAGKEKQTPPEKNGVESIDVQEQKQLKYTEGALRSSRENLKKAQQGNLDKKEAQKEIQFLDAELPGPATHDDQNNSVENSDILEAKTSIKLHEKAYDEQFKKTATAEKEKLKNDPEKLKTWETKNLNEYAKNLQIGQKPLDENGVDYLAQTFPQAWKETLLNPESSKDNPELQKAKNGVMQRVIEGAASIESGDYDSTEAYQQALLKNFTDITGVEVDMNTAEGILKEFINDPKNPENKAIIQTLAPIAATGSSGESRKWQEQMENHSFYDANPDTVQNIGEIFGDDPDFNQLKSMYDGIAEPNPKINEFHRAAGLNAGPKTPWCMSFVQYVLRKHYGYQGPKTASARDGLKIGTSTPHPGPGDLVLMPRNGGSGYHIAFVEKMQGNQITYWGGNQSNKVCSKTTSITSNMQFRQVTGQNHKGDGH